MPGTIITVGDIEMNSMVPDVNGSVWLVQGWEGWDAPAQRVQTMERPTVHGLIGVQNLYAARTVVITGICKSPSQASYYDAKYYLAAQTNKLLASDGLQLVVEEDIVRYCNVVRSAPPKMRHIGGSTFEFVVTLRADDPLKYAVTETTLTLAAATPQAAVNNGSERTAPIVTLTATGTPVITYAGLTWTATASMPSGTIIDMALMTAKNGTTNLFNDVDRLGDWITIAPGSSNIESSVAASVVWHDAWI